MSPVCLLLPPSLVELSDHTKKRPSREGPFRSQTSTYPTTDAPSPCVGPVRSLAQPNGRVPLPSSRRPPHVCESLTIYIVVDTALGVTRSPPFLPPPCLSPALLPNELSERIF